MRLMPKRDKDAVPVSRADNAQPTSSAEAVGAVCTRCGNVIRADAEIRRTVAGDWVHLAC